MLRRRKSSAPKRRDPRQARAFAKVSVILEAAGQILREEGKASFTTNRIAERAGVSIGTLYEYFPGKQAIIIELARQLLQGDGRAVINALENGTDAAGSDLIRPLIAALFTRHRADTEFRRLVLSAYLGEGLGPIDARHIQSQIEIIARHPKGPFAGRPIDAVRLFVVTRAVLGIARTLTDDESWRGLPPQQIEDETLRLVLAYLGQDPTSR